MIYIRELLIGVRFPGYRNSNNPNSSFLVSFPFIKKIAEHWPDNSHNLMMVDLRPRNSGDKYNLGYALSLLENEDHRKYKKGEFYFGHASESLLIPTFQTSVIGQDLSSKNNKK